MQAGGSLVGALVELGPGADGGEHDFQRRPAHFGMDVDGNAAAVVGHAEAAVVVDFHVDVVAKAGQGFIDAVVDQFVDEMMQPLGAGVADVHAGPVRECGRRRGRCRRFRDCNRSAASAVAWAWASISSGGLQRFFVHGSYPFSSRVAPPEGGSERC